MVLENEKQWLNFNLCLMSLLNFPLLIIFVKKIFALNLFL